MSLEIFTKAELLPDEWDSLSGDNPYIKREFLKFIEKTEKDYNPKYYLFYDGERADSLFIAFKRKGYNIAMFTKFNLIISATFIYLPMCVTRSGIVLGKLKEQVFEEIKKIKGYKIILNMEEPNAPDFATGLTCPKCILNVKWKSLDEYLFALRSDYRNRAKKILKRTKDIKIRFIDGKEEFDGEKYQLYLNVLNSSRMRIETLSREYFQGEFFKIFVAELDGKTVGFTQLLENGEELIFEFVGVDYSINDKIPVYHRMLLEIIDYAALNGFKTVDFGQTADDTKLKLGSNYVYLYAYLHHSNPIVNFFCKVFGKKLAYKPIKSKFHVFKGE